MILAVDVGNTRLKWGLTEAPEAGFRVVGVVGLDEIERLDQLWRGNPAPSRVGVASVAAAAVNERVNAVLERYDVPPKWLASQASACGVTNRYDNPAQLGIDRFAALVAARARHRGECLVVTAGTATTVDILAADGTFRGGLILPGLELMKRALADNTAGLALERGAFRDEPRNTADAIQSGCLHAQSGAIERMWARCGTGAVCFVSGGAAAAIVPLLAFATRPVEHLVLEGVARLVAA